MPFDPNDDTPTCPPGAPKADPANSAAPWSAATLAQFDVGLKPAHDAAKLAPVERVYASHLPHAPWLPAPVQSGPTGPEIKIDESTPRASNERQHLPPPALWPDSLRDIAGSPLNSLAGTAYLSNELSFAAELLPSSPCSTPVLLRHVTPEFDSTDQIMRIPGPRQTQSATVLQAVSASSSFQPDIDQVQMRSLSAALDNAWLAHQPRPAATAGNVPQSASPPLTRLPAVLPPMQRASDRHDAEYPQALARSQEIYLTDSDSDSSDVEVVGTISPPSQTNPGSGASGDL